MRIAITFVVAVCICGSTVAGPWPQWRGPHGNGVSDEKNLPLKWSATENVRWKVPLSGAGVSAPAVWGKHVILTSSDGRLNDRLHLVCIDADSGKQLWQSKFFGSALPEGLFPPGGMAVPTPATDGKHVVALYGTGDLVCVDFDGKPLWVRSLAQEYGPFRNRWGMSASPILAGKSVVVQVDHFGESYLLAVDVATGVNRWRTKRDATVNWSSPLVVMHGGKQRLVVAGTHTLRGYDPETGKEVWKADGLKEQCIPTPVESNGKLFLLGAKDSQALCLTTAGEPVWTVRTTGNNIPSPVILDHRLYYAEDGGFAVCLDAKTGKRLWRGRLGSKQQASPIAGDGKVYFAGETGIVTVLKTGDENEELARNDIGETIVASPALSDGRLYLRGSKHLFCIGK